MAMIIVIKIFIAKKKRRGRVAHKRGDSQAVNPPQDPAGDPPLDQWLFLGRIQFLRLVLDRTLALAVYNDIVVRWEEFLKNGLPTKERDKILKKYPPPNNCLAIDPPKLNPVVKISLQDLTLKAE